jgi:hypothetical protein
MKYVYACVVGIQAPESLCYLLMYLNPTLNKDYLLYVTVPLCTLTVIGPEINTEIDANIHSTH